MGKIGRVLIADDHSLFRSGLSKLLASRGIEVVGEAADGFEAVECALRTTPDIILMDVRMPRCDGLQATRRIVELMPRVRVVMLTVSEDDDDLFAAIRAGARGYLLKNVEPDDLIRLLEGLTEGEAPVSGSMTSRLLVELASQVRSPDPAVPPPTHALTARELQVLRCIASGSSNREVAEHLAISENTVKNHLRSILEKLHLGNRVQAVAYAIRQGIVQESVQTSGNR